MTEEKITARFWSLSPFDKQLTAKEELQARMETLTRQIERRQDEINSAQRQVADGLSAIGEMKRLRSEYNEILRKV